MPRNKRLPLADISLGELKRMVAIKERMSALEEKRDRLQGELAEIQAAIAKLTGAEAPAAGRRRQRGRKPARKPGRKPGRQPGRLAGRRGGRGAAASRAVRAAGKAVGKAAGKRGRQAGRRAAPATARAKRAGAGGTLQEVVAGLIRAHGSPMAFQDILRTIQSRKLVKTKSKDFANVLRRTLSTSKLVKRVARGTYGVAA